VPDGQSLVPGDLVLCGAAAIIDNVGLYMGKDARQTTSSVHGPLARVCDH
jgi:hypothetical protein